MGIVYEAEQQSPKRPVALKVVRGERAVDEISLKLFHREAATLARLRHPGIAAIYESGRTDDGRHFFAMELVRGPTLGEWIRSRQTNLENPAKEIRVRLGIFRQICDAVSYAHQRGVIHRDIKPSNVMLVSGLEVAVGDVSVPSIKILDFGLARITDSDLAATTLLSEVGRIAGTLPYMSPEQLRGNPDEIDLRTDVYSLGVLLFELLTGQLPYEIRGSMLQEVVRIISEERPRPLSSHWIGTRRPDRDIETIVQKALEKGPTRRYQGVAALSEDIDRYLGGQPILARPSSAGYQLRKLVARHKAGFALAAASVLFLAIIAVVMTVQAKRIALERDQARLETKLVAMEAEAFYALFREEGDRGIRLLREALGLHRKALGNSNPDLVPHLYKLAGVLSLFGGGSIFGAENTTSATREIEQLDTEALGIRRRAYSSSDPRVLESMKVLADEIVRREPDRADSLYRGILAIRQAAQHGGPEIRGAKLDLAGVLRLRGVSEEEKDQFPPGEKHFRESLALIHDAGGEASELMEGELALGLCLTKEHQFGEAESLLLQSLARAKDITADPTRQHEARVTQAVANLYESWGKPAQEALYRTNWMKIMRYSRPPVR